MTRVHRLFRRLVVGLALLLLIWQGWYFGWVVWWKYVDPGQTAFMRHRLAELRLKKPAATLRHQWVAYDHVAQALKQAVETRTAVFWSTSRNELWEKGKTSGETFELVEVRVNCEQNSLLYIVRPRRGGICHTKNRQGAPRNCYYRRINLDTLALENTDL